MRRIRPALPAHYILILVAALPSVMARVVASLYLVTDANASPMTVTIYLNSTTVLGIVVTFVAGKGHLDRHNPGRVACISLIFTLLNAGCLLLAPSSLSFLIPAVIFGAFAQLLVPSLFMLDELYRAGQPASSNGMYHTRLVISLVWIVGPPISFYLYWLLGFSGIMLATAAMVVASCLSIVTFAPRAVSVEAGAVKTESGIAASPLLGFRLTFVVMILVTAANVLHSIVLPLFLIQTLGASSYLPGLSMAVAAGTEVLAIGLIPLLLRSLAEETLLSIGLLLGVTYFLLLSLASSLTAILVLQVLYGAHFALATVVCLGILRKSSRQRMGGVASQFVNAGKIGGLVGAGLFGLFAKAVGLPELLTRFTLVLVIIPTLAIVLTSLKPLLFRDEKS